MVSQGRIVGPEVLGPVIVQIGFTVFNAQVERQIAACAVDRILFSVWV